MKKVSVVIPCFNQGKYVNDAIESALNQTYKNIEIICVNDASTDNSAEIIANLKNINFINLKENKGVINARNLAIDASCGEYILPLDADDKIEPTYIEKAVEILNNKPEIGIVYCKARFFGEKMGEWKLPEFNQEDFIYANCIFNCALFRKSDFYKAGKYKENMESGCEDWDLWLSFVELGLKPHRIDEVLFNYRQYQNTRSTTINKSIEWKKSLIKNHIELYLTHDSFIERIFTSQDAPKKIKKLKKFTKMFSVLAFRKH